MWIKLLPIILQIAGYIAKYLSDKQLIDAGEAKATLKGIEEARSALNRARIARNAIDYSLLDPSRDEYNRDNDNL